MIHVDTEKYAGMASAVGSMSVSQRKTMQLNALILNEYVSDTRVSLLHCFWELGWGGVSCLHSHASCDISRLGKSV